MLRRRPVRSPRGLAEIVGTLMLVLIVVSAAVAFSFFVASYQAQLQANEAANHAKSLESVNVIGLTATPATAGSSDFGWLNMTVTSGTVESEWISGILVNGNPVQTFNATDRAINATGTVTVGLLKQPWDNNTTLYLAPLSLVQISINMSNPTTNPYFAFFSPTDVPTSTDFLVLTFETSRGNAFQATYVPPTAIADVSYLTSNTGSSTTEYPLLDGTHSFQTGENATIVSWSWYVVDAGTTTPALTPDPVGGAQVELTTLTAGDSYTATLTIENSVGQFAVSLPLTFVA